MNKTIIININSIVFHIEEDAYEALRSYMIEIKRHFGNSEDSREILEDIENRIAEMFSERIQSGRKEVINHEDVNQVIGQMGRVSDFETELGHDPLADAPDVSGTESKESHQQEHTADTEPNSIPFMTSKKLMRDMDDKVFGGVCSGLSHFFSIDSKWIRVIFVLFFLVGGSGVLLYFVLWAVMPKALTRADRLAMKGEQANLQNFKKSFDEEMKGSRENFTGAGEHIKRGARSVGDIVGRILSIIGKVIAVIVLTFAGVTVFGMFIFFVFNVLNIMGYQNPIYFPPLEMLDSTSAFFAILAGTLAVGIPFLALFFILLRVVFGSEGMNNYVKMTLWAAWIVSIVMILYFVVITNQDFEQESTISVEKSLEKQDSYQLLNNDIRVIRAKEEDFNRKGHDLAKRAGVIGNFLRDDIGIRIEPLDSLEAPYIQYNYRAKGSTYGNASDRASKINYQIKQDGEELQFDSHFTLHEQQLIRDQRVTVVVYLPVGTKVSLARELDYRVRDVHTHDCRLNDRSRFSEWVMTGDGLHCTTEKPEEEDQDDQDD